MSMLARQHLHASQSELQTAMQRLSSGLRINSAKDDAAGQAIANRMTAQIRGLAQAQRNANDGISLVQTAEGALNQVNDNLQRIRELSVQAANGTLSARDRASIQNEVDQRLEEINRLTGQTDFNGVKPLGQTRSLSIQVGANDGQVIDIELPALDLSGLGLEDFSVEGEDEGRLAQLDEALRRVDRQRSYLGATHNRLEGVIDNLATTQTNLAASRSRIMDADYAVEVSRMVRAQILQQASAAILAQANQLPNTILTLLGR
ncbi:flagellin FliC [Halomonas sp. ML-15]|nr:flagellin FliC [Halomonas sp. ML-15]